VRLVLKLRKDDTDGEKATKDQINKNEMKYSRNIFLPIENKIWNLTLSFAVFELLNC